MTIVSAVITLMRLFRSAFGEYRWQIGVMALLSLVSGMLEGLGINAVIPLFSFIGGGGGAPTDSLSLLIARLFSFLHLPYSARSVLLLIVILFIAKAIFLLISQQVTAIIAADFEKKTRAKLLAATLQAKWPFLSKQKVGHLDQLLTTDVSSSAAILTYLSSAVLVLVNLIIYTGLVFNLSQIAALSAFLSGILIFLGFKPLLSKTKVISEKMVKKYKDIAHFASEHVIGAKVIKAMHLERQALFRGGIFLEEMRNFSLRSAFLRNIVPMLLQLIGVFFTVGLFVFLYKTTAFQFAAFAVVVFAFNKVFSNLQFAQTNLHAISVQIPYLESVMRYEREAKEQYEREVGGLHFAFEKEIRFNQVDFTYRANEPALSSVSFGIKKGEIIGLIGPSGAGKTTAVDLLLRLIEPTNGSVTIDGKDITAIGLNAWRTHLGYVPQDVFLVNDTIENNIKFYDRSLSDTTVYEAARMAHIYDFIKSQPLQFQTPVGERGTALSGGQRQRIALARALARSPDILILDEATSALDHESEAAIQKAVETLRGKITVIIIAHRLSTINIADNLVVIDKGRVLEAGNPTALLRNPDSYFSKLYASTK